ncbi:MAG TPA: hypothetical protein VJA66_15140 [Thermoanaerobaculia bacterium]
MGKIPSGPFEVRLAATLFLLLVGLANLFGAWEVRNFSAFTPGGVAASLAPAGVEGTGMSMHDMPMGGREGHDMSSMGHEGHDMTASSAEKPISLETLDRPRHHIDRDLLVQDSHVHIPAYAMTAAFLVLIVFGLKLSSRTRALLVLLAFAAPFLDFLGLWTAHLSRRASFAGGLLAVGGGFLMGLVYLIVLASTLWQCWLHRQGETDA